MCDILFSKSIVSAMTSLVLWMKNDSLKLVFSIHRDYSDYDTYWKKVQSEQEI